MSRVIELSAIWLGVWCRAFLWYTAMENGTGCLESAGTALENAAAVASAPASSSADDAGDRCRLLKEGLCNNVVDTQSKAPSALLEQIEALRATQRELRDHARRRVRR